MNANTSKAANVLTFDVLGLPTPQGSKNARALPNGRVVMWEASAKSLRPWRDAVASHARLAVMTAHEIPQFVRPMRGPVSVTLAFRLPKPKSNRDAFPIGARTGDLDKLARACLDALAEGTGAGVFANDSQVTRLELTKAWANGEGEPGVTINVRRIE